MPDDIISFLRANMVVEDRQPGDASASEAAEQMGCTQQTATRKLRRLVRDGLASEHTVRASNGGTMTVYRLIKCEPPGG